MIITIGYLHRHTSDMIKKLESAGLGFFVEAAKIQHKLGKKSIKQYF